MSKPERRPEKIFVVDGNNLLVRAIKALEHSDSPALMANGVETGPVHVFIKSLSRYVRDAAPDRVVVCWDGGHAYRSEIFPDYKKDRGVPSRHENPSSHFGLAKQFLTLAGVHHATMQGEEADDLIAHYWRIRELEDHMVILSGDKDLLQLLEPNVTQIRPGDKLAEEWTHERVEYEMGCPSMYLPLALALTGDVSDGIPGVNGVGMKTAVKMLTKAHWSLHELVTETPRLVGQRDLVHRNFALVNLRTARGLSLDSPPRFMPTEPDTALGDSLQQFLLAYELHQVYEQWMARKLWQDPHRREDLGLELLG